MNTLSSDIEIIGEVRLKGDWFIEGRIEGRIETDGALVVGPDAYVCGEILARTVTVHGRVDAMIHALERCELLSTADVTGGISAFRCRIEDGASFAGRTIVGLYPLSVAKSEPEAVQPRTSKQAAPQRAA